MPSAGRSPVLPNVPSIAEAGLADLETDVPQGMLVPAGTPKPVVDLLNKAVGEALKDPKLVARLAEIGGIPKPMTPAEFDAFVRREIALNGEIDISSGSAQETWFRADLAAHPAICTLVLIHEPRWSSRRRSSTGIR